MGTIKKGNKRLLITLPEKLIEQLEADTRVRGLNLSKSARIQLAIEDELRKSARLQAQQEKNKLKEGK